MKSFSACLLPFLYFLSAPQAVEAQGTSSITVPGPLEVGNGVPNGLGATLGRFYFLLERPQPAGEPESDAIPLQIVVTSSLFTVDPITCSAPSTDPCESPGAGNAEVAGAPTAALGGVFMLKLASALYLYPPDGRLSASSLEFALEGSLYADVHSPPGSTADLRLFLGNPGRIHSWGADESTPASSREFRQNTGAGILIGDSQFYFFPGWLRGKVTENGGFAMLVEFFDAELSPVRIGDETKIWLAPDFDGALAAGLPEGDFGQIEINYSGFATLSRIVPGAASNDVEVRRTAVEQRFGFVRGDCDGNGAVAGTVADALTLLSYSFTGGRRPPCLAACDADGDGTVLGNLTDAIYLLLYAFKGGTAPPAPFPECGAPPEPSAEACDFPSC